MDKVFRTKIVCTIGPASRSYEILCNLAKAGMNVARLNLSHCSYDFAKEVIDNIKKVNSIMHDSEIGIWCDTNGPKVRSGKLKDGNPVYLEAGQEFSFVNDLNVVGDNTKVSVTYTKKLVDVGDNIYVDDGLLSFKVVERGDDVIKTIVLNSGLLGENKGINCPSHVIEDLPALSEKDRADIYFALDHQADFISVSCIRSFADVEEARILMGNTRTKLLAKIENKMGLDDFESILKMADGCVIDRGYLGAEIELEMVTTEQKRCIQTANTQGKLILVANQMLESMRENPRPTRSEASDITNAVMDGADGLVLSGETAIGKYVVESCQIMRKLAKQAENSVNYSDYAIGMMRLIPKPIGVSESIASSAVVCARQVNAAVIVCITELGGTARLVAKYRPQIPVIAATLIDQTARQLNLSFGIVPFYHSGSADTVIKETLAFAVQKGLCKPGQIAVITSGQVIGFLEGTTTQMQVVQVPECK